MKLHELGDSRQSAQLAQALASHTGKAIDLARIGPRRAQGMLEQVRRLLGEARNSARFHHSEKDGAYLQLLMMEQALVGRLSEQNPPQAAGAAGPAGNTAAVANPAQAAAKMRMADQERKKQLRDAIKAKQDELRDLQKQLSAPPSATTAMESVNLVESELQQAQVVLAAQDMVDQVQGMMEDISEMQFKDLPALSQSIKNDMGVEQATAFQAAASAALTTLLQSVQTAKTALEGAQGALTGQTPVVPGDVGAEVGAAMGAELGAAAGAEAGAEMGAELPAPPPADDEEEEPESDDTAALGRERR